jgi:hypothetical protein
VIVPDFFVVGEVRAGVGASCSQWLPIGWVSLAKGPFQSGVFSVEDVPNVPSSDVAEFSWRVTATVSPAHLDSKERKDLMIETKMEVIIRIAKASMNPSIYRE